MEKYDISSHCICGAINVYCLSFPVWPIVRIGAKQEENHSEQDGINTALCSDISLCGDDPHLNTKGQQVRYLSRNMFYFAYDLDICDWVMGAGKPLPKYINCYKKLFGPDTEDNNRKARSNDIWYLSKSNFKELIKNSKPYLLDGEKHTCQTVPLEYFTRLANAEETVPLSEIALICLFRKGDKDIYYKNKLSNERIDPLLGRIPFAWYFSILKGEGLKLKVIKDFQKAITQY